MSFILLKFTKMQLLCINQTRKGKNGNQKLNFKNKNTIQKFHFKQNVGNKKLDINRAPTGKNEKSLKSGGLGAAEGPQWGRGATPPVLKVF